MSTEFLINFTPQETRVAIVEQGVVQELHVERTASRGIVGNVYLGKVVRVLPGMQSAFINVGLDRTAFLHVADIWSERQNGDGPRPIERILTDNGVGYRSKIWAARCAELDIKHSRTKPYRPATNGKVERFNRTLLDEWAYARLWKSDAARARTLDRFLHRYNHHRHHTAIGGPPASRVTDLAEQQLRGGGGGGLGHPEGRRRWTVPGDHLR